MISSLQFCILLPLVMLAMMSLATLVQRKVIDSE